MDMIYCPFGCHLLYQPHAHEFCKLEQSQLYFRRHFNHENHGTSFLGSSYPHVLCFMHEMVVVNFVAAKGSDGGGLSLGCRDRLAIYSARSLPRIIHYFFPRWRNLPRLSVHSSCVRSSNPNPRCADGSDGYNPSRNVKSLPSLTPQRARTRGCVVACGEAALVQCE